MLMSVVLAACSTSAVSALSGKDQFSAGEDLTWRFELVDADGAAQVLGGAQNLLLRTPAAALPRGGVPQ